MAENTDDDPVKALGFRGLSYFYRRVKDGAVIELHARDHTPEGLLGLAGGDLAFYWESWGNDETDTIDWPSVVAYLMGCCVICGEFQPPRTAADLAR